MNEVISIVAGEALSRSIDWAKAGISGVIERRKIAKLIEATAVRARMVSSSIDLGAKFQDTQLIEELLAHRSLMDISKHEAIALFLGSDADITAWNFIEEFYNEVNRIASNPDDPLSSRRAAENTDEILRRMNSSRAEEQVPLLEELIRWIAADRISVERIRELSRGCHDSAAAAYLGAYHALCTDGHVDFSALDWMKGHDVLVEALSSVALSAKRQDDIDELTGFFSFDATDFACAMKLAIAEPRSVGERVYVKVPDGKDLDGLIGLINFEHLCGLNAYHAAAQLANNCAITWNPLARERLAAAKIASSVMFKLAGIEALVVIYTSRYRAWFPREIRRLYEGTISLALVFLDEVSARRILANIPDGFGEFVEDESRKLELRFCEDALTAFGFVNWAASRRNPEFLISAAGKTIEIDASMRDRIVPIFEQNKEWALPTPDALHYYSKEINPKITYASFLELGSRFDSRASFHLGAYDKFKDDDPVESSKHIERALELMRPPTGTPELLYSSIWVPYLVANNRENEVLEIVSDVLPLAPMDFLVSFLNVVLRESEGLLNQILDSIANAEFEDPASAEVVASYFESSNKTEIAGRIAMKAFVKRPSDRLAEIAVRWKLSSALDIDQSLIRYAEERDNCRMNLLIANIEHEIGSSQKCNSFLLRAAFRDDPDSWRALLLYSVWNAGGGDEPRVLDAICRNCAAKLKVCDCESVTVIFLSDRRAVWEEGAVGLAGIAYSTDSATYMRLRGRRVGDAVEYGGKSAVIESIDDARTILMRAGFVEVPKVPGGMVITGDPEDLIGKLAEIMASNQDNSRLAQYMNGFDTESGKLFLGIDAGRMIAPTRQLEFTISAVIDPAMPYRRMPTCKNFAGCEDGKFILSQSAIIVLSLLNVSSELVAAIQSRCVVTLSTARKLRKEANQLTDEICEGDGRLSFDGAQPLYIEFGEMAKRDATEKGLAIIGMIDKLETVDPVIDCSDVRLLKALPDTSVIDVQTALEGDYAFVTEDLLEACLVEEFGLPKRCSITALFLYLGLTDYVLHEYLQKMLEWEATPPLEIDVVDAINRTISKSIQDAFCDEPQDGADELDWCIHD